MTAADCARERWSTRSQGGADGAERIERHYSSAFVGRGGHRAVAEVLNEGQCDALVRILRHSSPVAIGVTCVPLFVYACRVGDAPGACRWSLTAMDSAESFVVSARKLIRKRELRESLLRHGADDVARVHHALASRGEDETIVVRLTIVLSDESSHVNALIIRGSRAELFEPKMQFRDTECRPYGSVRTQATHMVRLYGVALEVPPRTSLVLQTNDDLCQTWVAAYVKERVCDMAAPQSSILSRLRPNASCDRLCALLRFSEWVYESVPFPRRSRRGETCDTLAAVRKTTSRSFRASPRPCRAASAT